ASLFCLHGRTYSARDFGSDPAAPRAAAVYFNMLFYKVLRLVETEGLRSIHYGRSSAYAKLSRGCRSRRLWHLIAALPAWDRDTRQVIASASRERITAEIRELTVLHKEAVVREQL